MSEVPKVEGTEKTPWSLSSYLPLSYQPSLLGNMNRKLELDFFKCLVGS